MSNAEKDFLREVKKQLDQSSENLDAGSRSRLNQIRNNALDQGRKKVPMRPWLWAGGLGLPAIALAVIIFFGLPNQQTLDPQAPQVATVQPEDKEPSFDVAVLSPLPQNMDPDDLEILLSEDDIEMLVDLDFLNWLASTDEVGG